MNRIASLLTALVLAVFAVPALAQDKPAVPAYQERVLGNTDAPVTIIEYSSLTCPHCADFHRNLLPEVKKEFIDTGKAKLIFRDFPLDPLATAAAMVARCAPENSYFRLLETLFANQDAWARSNKPLEAISGYARLAGVSGDALTACLQSEDMLSAINGVKAEGTQKYGVRGTPTLIVNDQVLDAYTDLPTALVKATN